jgi:hypothetical protein
MSIFCVITDEGDLYRFNDFTAGAINREVSNLQIGRCATTKPKRPSEVMSGVVMELQTVQAL